MVTQQVQDLLNLAIHLNVEKFGNLVTICPIFEQIFLVVNKQFTSLKSLVFNHHSYHFVLFNTKQLIPIRIPPLPNPDAHSTSEFIHNSNFLTKVGTFLQNVRRCRKSSDTKSNSNSNADNVELEVFSTGRILVRQTTSPKLCLDNPIQNLLETENGEDKEEEDVTTS